MNSVSKKSFVAIFGFLLFGIFLQTTVFLTPVVHAQKGYTLLADIPTVAVKENPTLPVYLRGLVVAIVGLAIVLAVIMIVMGGIQYVLAAIPSSKEDGKKRIIGALSGLLLILLSYILLQAINPELLKVGLNLTQTVFDAPNAPSPPGTGGTPPGTGGTPPGTGGKGSGNGRCEPMTSSLCSVSNLARYFGAENAENASMICNVESAGGNPMAASGSDRCKDGTSFSYGLFQINLTAEDIDGLPCEYRHPNAAFNGYNYACTGIKNNETFTKCYNAAVNPDKNIAYAVKLFKARGWQPWTTTANKCGISIR